MKKERNSQSFSEIEIGSGKSVIKLGVTIASALLWSMVGGTLDKLGMKNKYGAGSPELTSSRSKNVFTNKFVKSAKIVAKLLGYKPLAN